MSDVVVIGASLAGTATAITLAQQGVRVTLIDKSRFPRRKPCGEGLSGRGQHELRAIGFDVAQHPRLLQPLRGYKLLNATTAYTIPDDVGLIGIRRFDLDHKLLEVASNFSSITYRLGAPVDRLEADGRMFRVTADGDTFTSPYVVIADGVHSPALRALGRRITQPSFARLGSSSSWGITHGTISPFVHTSLIEGGEIYLTPLSERGLNVSLLGTKALIQRAAHPSLLVSLARPLFERLGIKAEMIAPPVGSRSLNSTYHGADYRGAFVVGDACESFDPCAGCGMTHALLSGRLAGHHIARALASSSRDEELVAYARARDLQARSMRGYTRLTSFMMGTKVGRLGLPLAASTGLACMVSQAAHSSRAPFPVKRLVSLVGRSA
jgi:flavin-dependent dehydrogenase